jgi:ABC-type branched-subunit amino acid transport system ATPase component
MKAMNALEVHHITKSFGGVRAVDDCSLVLPRGRITAIIGPNGSGKSTLVNVISGMIPFESGVIQAGDRKTHRLLPEDAPMYGIARTFQEVRVFEQMTVEDNITIVLTPRSAFASLRRDGNKAHHDHLTDSLLAAVGLADARRKLASDLSYGQRKLLEVARILAMTKTDEGYRIGMFLFDEPFAGLFPYMVSRIAESMRMLRDDGKAVLLVEHNMELVRSLADEVVVMDCGRVLAKGIPDEVLSRRDVIEAYLGE